MLEIRCSRTGRFSHEDAVLVSGDGGHAVSLEITHIVVSIVDWDVPTLLKAWGAPETASATPPSLYSQTRALLVEFVGSQAPIEHAMYGVATCVALASLVLGRPPRSDVAVLSAIDQGGYLKAPSPRCPITAAEVQACVAAGIRRLILSPAMTLADTAEEALQEAAVELEIVRYKVIEDVWASFFG